MHKLKYIGTKTLKKLKKQNIHQHIPGIKKLLLKNKWKLLCTLCTCGNHDIQ